MYVRWRVGSSGDSGLANFTWPLAGVSEKWITAIRQLYEHGWSVAYGSSLCAVIALSAQALFFLTRWEPTKVWWRVRVATGH
jgi:hypothetical protein